MDLVFANEKIGLNSEAVSHFEILEDKTGSYSFEEISALDNGSQYGYYPAEVISLGITESVYWVRFKVGDLRGSANGTEKLIQMKNPNIDKIDIYIPVGQIDSVEEHYIAKGVGMSRPNFNRDIMDNTWVFQIPPELNAQKYIYLRLESTSAIRLPIVCWNSKSFIADSFLKNLGFGAFYGTLLVMILFNLFIYFVLRDKAYLFYVFISVSGSWASQDVA